MATVMVLDPDHRFVARLRCALQAAGHQAVTAPSVGEALRLMHQQAPDVVVSEVAIDYVMAGWDLVRAMMADAVLSHVPVVIVTSSICGHGHEEAMPAESVDVDAWLPKPVAPEEVVKRVASLLVSTEAT